MREYLFRGKKVDNGKWVYGNLIDNECCKKPIIVEVNYLNEYGDLGEVSYEVDEKTVSQYCGLTDMNGKKIYEGDIVKTKYGRLCVVEWRSTPCFCGFDLTVCVNWDDFGKAPSSWDLYMSQNLEIVGNIYDNPNLLNKE